MPKTLRSPRQLRLIEFIVERRKSAGLSQMQLAERLGRYQSVVAAMESGGRRIDIVELMDLARVIGFDPREVIDELEQVPTTLSVHKS